MIKTSLDMVPPIRSLESLSFFKVLISMVKLLCWCIMSVLMLDELTVSIRVCLFSSLHDVV